MATALLCNVWNQVWNLPKSSFCLLTTKTSVARGMSVIKFNVVTASQRSSPIKNRDTASEMLENKLQTSPPVIRICTPQGPAEEVGFPMDSLVCFHCVQWVTLCSSSCFQRNEDMLMMRRRSVKLEVLWQVHCKSSTQSINEKSWRRDYLKWCSWR